MTPSAVWRSAIFRVARWPLLGIGFAIVLVAGARVLTSPGLLATDDFVQYWASGRVALLGGNPYDPAALKHWQTVAGRSAYEVGAPTIVWNPPWLLPFLIPFGALPYAWARVAWFSLQLVLIVVSSDRLWRLYGGKPDSRVLAWALALAFPPTLIVLGVGQLGPLLMAAVVGFLVAETRERWLVAGACVVLLAAKPQLFHLLFTAMALWIVTERRFSVVLGGTVALTVTLGLSLAADSDVIAQYVTAVTTYPPVEWATPTLGGWLRLAFGVQYFWLQFLPAVLGNVWLCWYWWRHRRSWTWAEEMPFILAMALVTAPYLWSYDLVLLVMPAIQVASRRLPASRGRSLRASKWAISYVALVLMMAVQSQLVQNDFWSLWFAPVFILWYVLARPKASITAQS